MWAATGRQVLVRVNRGEWQQEIGLRNVKCRPGWRGATGKDREADVVGRWEGLAVPGGPRQEEPAIAMSGELGGPHL